MADQQTAMIAGTDPIFGVDGKVMVVTGGLGRLGQQFTRTLLARGAYVAVLDLDVDRRKSVLNDLDRKESSNLILCETDITHRSDLEQALSRIVQTWQTPHGLINNAAIDTRPDAPVNENGPFEEFPVAVWDRVMEVNTKGVFLTCQVIGGAMAVAGRGSIINVSSTYGLVGPDQRLYEHLETEGKRFYKPVAYSASKSTLLNLTRYLATYWANRNLRVNTITLGGVAAGQDTQFVAAYEARTPLARMANEDEYNGAIVYLLSDASSYMTGSNLVIDGGWTAW